MTLFEVVAGLLLTAAACLGLPCLVHWVSSVVYWLGWRVHGLLWRLRMVSRR